MQTFWWRLTGIIVGIIAGGILAALTGELIARAFRISNFEGGRGYFVIFVIIPLFVIVGAILGAIMIMQGWRFNLSILGILLLGAGGFAVTYRQIFFNLPYQTEKLGNFELQTYASESYGDHCGLRYLGKHFDIEEQAGKAERQRRVNSFVLLTPTLTPTATAADAGPAPHFLVSIGEPNDTRAFYLVGEKAGAAFAAYLCDTTVDAVDALDQQPLTSLTSSLEPQTRQIYLHRKAISGSRWLLLGNACVFDVQTATPYPFTTLLNTDDTTPQLENDHLPVALSPDRHSLVRLALRNEYDAKTSEHLGYSLHLLVNNFVEDTSYLLAIDRQRLRVNRQATYTGWVDDINQQWLDHHFTWQKGGDGHERPVERTQFAPWPFRGWLSGYGNDLEYRIVWAKPEMLDKLEEFLIAHFGAKRIKHEHSAEGGTISTAIQLQLEDKELTLSFRRDDYSPSQISFWHSAPDPRNGEWLKKIAQAVQQQLQSGVYDDLFIFEQFL